MTHLRLPILFALAATLLIACEQKSTDTAAPPAEPAATTSEATPDPVKELDAVVPVAAQDEAKDNDLLGFGSTPDDIEDGASHVYGNPFTIIEPPITLASAIAKAGSDGVGPYKVEATVEKVCQKKGCWFTLKGEDVAMPIRVKMKDYAFFVPRNATNLPVVLEGTFKQVTVPEADAQHYADDEAENTGKPARKITGDQESWEFTAVAVQIDNKKG